MGALRKTNPSLLVIACFSRHPEALDWAALRLQDRFGPIGMTSADFDFHHTEYYKASMGSDLKKRFLAFSDLAAPDSLPETKLFTNTLEAELAKSGAYSECRPLNLDPGLLQLGKFLLATTKDQSHRIYLRDGIFAEVTLRFQAGAYEAWPWTYADYREPAVRSWLGEARAYYLARVQNASP